MRDIITNFLFLNPLNVTGLVMTALALIWLALVIVGVWSILSQNLSGAGKAGWILSVVCLPLVGMYAYTFYCLFSADHSWLNKFRK